MAQLFFEIVSWRGLGSPTLAARGRIEPQSRDGRVTLDLEAEVHRHARRRLAQLPADRGGEAAAAQAQAAAARPRPAARTDAKKGARESTV